HLCLFTTAEVGQSSRVQDIGHAELRIRLTRSARRGGRFLEAACGEVCVREADVGHVQKGIERAEADRTRSVVHGRRVIALPRMDDGTETEREGRRARQREGSVEGSGCGLVVVFHYCDYKAGGRKRR